MIKNQILSDYLGKVFLYKNPYDETFGAFILNENTFSSQIISKVDYEILLKNEDYTFIDNDGFEGSVVDGKILLSSNKLTQDFFDETDIVKKNLSLLGYALKDSNLLNPDLNFLSPRNPHKFVQVGNWVSAQKNGFKSLLTKKEFVISEKENNDLSTTWILKSNNSISEVFIAPYKNYVIFENKDYNDKPISYEEIWDIWLQKQFAVYHHCLTKNSPGFSPYLEETAQYIDPTLSLLFSKNKET